MVLKVPLGALCACACFYFLFVCVDVLRPSQPNGSRRVPSVYLVTRLLGRLSPLSG